MIKTALMSLSDYTGLEMLLKTLKKYDVKIIATSGTAKKIRELGYENVTDVSAYTESPESPGGYVKTLHPRIHGGLIYKKTREHKQFMKENGILPFELVVSSFYELEEALSDPGLTQDEKVEKIDIGGPAIIRSALKGYQLHRNVTIVTNPNQYKELIEEIDKLGFVPPEMNLNFFKDASRKVREYIDVNDDFNQKFN